MRYTNLILWTTFMTTVCSVSPWAAGEEAAGGAGDLRPVYRSVCAGMPAAKAASTPASWWASMIPSAGASSAIREPHEPFAAAALPRPAYKLGLGASSASFLPIRGHTDPAPTVVGGKRKASSTAETLHDEAAEGVKATRGAGALDIGTDRPMQARVRVFQGENHGVVRPVAQRPLPSPDAMDLENPTPAGAGTPTVVDPSPSSRGSAFGNTRGSLSVISALDSTRTPAPAPAPAMVGDDDDVVMAVLRRTPVFTHPALRIARAAALTGVFPYYMDS